MSTPAKRSSSLPRTPVTTNQLYLLAITAIATTLMLQSMRIFTSYMVFVIDQSNRVELAMTVFGTFGTIALGGLLLKRIGGARTLLISAGLLAAGRLGLQVIELAEARLILGAIALMAWGWLMLAILRHWRESAATGIGFGIALDLVIRIANSSRDLPFNPGIVQHLISLILVAGLITGVIRFIRFNAGIQSPLARRNSASLLAIGPGIALYFIVTGNLGLVQETAGLLLPEGAFVIALGTAIGLRFALVAGDMLPSTEGGRVTLGPLMVAIFLAMGLFLIGQQGIIAVPGFILASATSIVLLSFAVAGRATAGDIEPSLGRMTLAFTGGTLLMVGLLFLYYMFSGMPVFLGIIAAAFVLLAIPAGVPETSRPIHQPRLVLFGAGAMAAALALVSAFQLFTLQLPEAEPPDRPEITVMTYNIQNGFNLDSQFDLEGIAQTIEREDPDVVVIQEISRGWLVAGDMDQVSWMSDRLDMPYIYGANSDDLLWGNAIFTRLPIEQSNTLQYSDVENLKRGAIEVALETEAGLLWVYGTHLDNPADADDVRYSQGRELIAFRDGKEPALVLGDFNSIPTHSLMLELADAGLRDLGADLPDDARTSPNRGRIDYILASDGVELIDIHITEIWTSDHLPVIATVQIAD